MSLGRIIKNLRIARDLSRDQLVGEEYSNSHIASVEQGVKRPSVQMLCYVADRLEVPLWSLAEELLGEYDVPTAELLDLARELTERDQLQEAMVVLDVATQHEDSVSDSRRVDAAKVEAEVEFRRGNHRRALEIYHRYRRIVEDIGCDAEVAEAYYRIGCVQFSCGNYRDALHWLYLAATRIYPVRGHYRCLSKSILRVYGQALLANEQPELGRKAFEHLLEVSDKGEVNYVLARYGAGLCALECAQHRDACRHLERAVCAIEKHSLPLQGAAVSARLHLGRGLMLNGEYSEALDQLDRSYSLQPRMQTVNVALQCLLKSSRLTEADVSTWFERVTDDLWSAASDEQRSLYRCLRAEIASERGCPRRALDEAVCAREYAPEDHLSLRLRTLSIQLRAAVRRGSHDICREIAEELREVSAGEITSQKADQLWEDCGWTTW